MNHSHQFDAEQEIQAIARGIKHELITKLRRRGAVVGVSGGIDSAVVLSLCVRAIGPKRVLAVLMPERESDPASHSFASMLVDQLGVEHITEDITPALDGFDCYRRRDEAVRRLFPDYDEHCRIRIGLPECSVEQDRINIFDLTMVKPDGETLTARLPTAEYLEITAASNFKQRARMCTLYYYAESRHYAVIGTSNRNEHELGFFVKYGDGGADMTPIRHLLKTQVYQLASALGVPPPIIDRPPTPDTYTAEHSHLDFFYRAPFPVLDSVWQGWEQGLPLPDIAETAGIPPDQAAHIIADIQRKQSTSAYLRAGA